MGKCILFNIKTFYKGNRDHLTKLRQIPVKVHHRDAFGTGLFISFIYTIFFNFFKLV